MPAYTNGKGSIVWCDYDGKHMRLNTTKERQEGENTLRNPMISLVIVNPENTSRYISIQVGRSWWKRVLFDTSTR